MNPARSKRTRRLRHWQVQCLPSGNFRKQVRDPLDPGRRITFTDSRVDLVLMRSRTAAEIRSDLDHGRIARNEAAHAFAKLLPEGRRTAYLTAYGAEQLRELDARDVGARSAPIHAPPPITRDCADRQVCAWVADLLAGRFDALLVPCLDGSTYVDLARLKAAYENLVNEMRRRGESSGDR
jgi:hypothetical protein